MPASCVDFTRVLTPVFWQMVELAELVSDRFVQCPLNVGDVKAQGDHSNVSCDLRDSILRSLSDSELSFQGDSRFSILGLWGWSIEPIEIVVLGMVLYYWVYRFTHRYMKRYEESTGCIIAGNPVAANRSLQSQPAGNDVWRLMVG